MSPRILLIEDNRDLALGLRRNLELEGYQVALCARGDRAAAEALGSRPDLIILDMMLPERDGFAVIDELRAGGCSAPVLCLTARGEETDKVRALRSGADDYVTKPFGLMELLARVQALLRRAGPADEAVIRIGVIEIDAGAREVRKDARSIALTPREFDLLLHLARAPGRVHSRQDLLRAVWGHAGAAVTRTVDTHVAELRRKLEDDPGRPRLILTARKAGYRIRATDGD